MHRPLRRILLVISISLIPAVAAPNAVAHEFPGTHVLRGTVVTTQGTLRIEAQEGVPQSLGTAWFTPENGPTVTIELGCLKLESFFDVYPTYSPLMPVVVWYGHAAYASGRGDNGKRYRITMYSFGLAGVPVIIEPHVTTRPAWKAHPDLRGPCGTSTTGPSPQWRRGGILILA